MKRLCPALVFLVSLANSMPAQTNTAPLPPLEVVLQRTLARAATEDDNDHEFNRHYSYTKVRVTEFRNTKGELKSSEEKRSAEGVKPKMTGQPAPPPPPKPVETNAPLSETHSNIRGKTLQVKDYSLTNLATRFQFTLVGREVVNGRPSLVLDFKPTDKTQPIHNYKDRFINKAAGRVWVDEADYAIAKANLHLSQPVSVLGGLVGSVKKFTYSFDRERTPEGYWYASHVDWHLEGREVIFHRVVDYHERKFDAQRVLQATR